MKSAHWIEGIEEVSEQVVGLLHQKDADLLNWKASGDHWSVYEVLEHLISVNSSYFPISDALRSGSYHPPLLGRINFFVNLFGRLILQSVQPTTEKKSRTFPIWRPQKSAEKTNSLERFLATQEKLKQWIYDNQDLIEQNPVISSPASNNVVYRFRVMLDIIVAHEKRHLLQIKNILVQAEQIEP